MTRKVQRLAKLRSPEPVEGDEIFAFLVLEFNVTLAQELVAGREVMHFVDPAKLANGMTRIDETYALSDAVDPDKPGIVVQLPGALGVLPIDGHHRAYKALHQGRKTFAIHVLTTDEGEAICYTKTHWRKIINGEKKREKKNV